MKDILISVFTLGILGALFGVLLGVFNEKFKVEVSPLAQAIYEVLPHGECGACGFPGCHPCAEAIAEGRASYDACVVGGKEVEEKIRKIMEEAKSQS
jgi:RnfABCDGE-type electron transport complex B subunit